jgi:Tol biopolymer transport system component
MEPLIVSSGADTNPQYSPDGTKIAFQSDRSGGGPQIWVAQSDGSNPVQLTRGIELIQESPHWSPDGKWIYFKSNRGETSELWRVALTPGTVAGANAEQVTTDVPATADLSSHQVPPQIAGNAFIAVADGIYYIGRPSEDGDYPLEFFQFSNRTSRLLTKIEGQVNRGLSISPDRKWILFSRNVSFGSDLMMIENFR